jgi:hypothetical protein
MCPADPHDHSPSPTCLCGGRSRHLCARRFEGPARVSTQSINPKLLDSRWAASWIRPKEALPRSFGVYLFRRTFDLPSAPSRFVVHATADQRYELFVNGHRVSTGPARGDLDHWRFETIDIAKQLVAGKNVLAAVVWNYGQEAPMAQVSYQTGFLVQGDGEAEAPVNTGQGWRTTVNPAITLLPIDRSRDLPRVLRRWSR